jgi:hypothetical protein
MDVMLEARDGVLGSDERAAHVDAQRAVELLHAHLVDCADHHEAGVVDQPVNGSERRHGEVERGGERPLVRHVDADRDSFAAVAAHERGRLLCAVEIEVGDDDARPGRRGPPADGATGTAGAAGDDDDAVLQVTVGHELSSRW